MNATLLQGTSTDVTMPRGSTSIHVYVVLGVSAGQVESDWPGGATPEDALMAIAAPHIMNPAAPTIEVTSFFDPSATPPAYKAKISIATRPGPRPRKIELHRVRVDDAAKELDSMGPAILRLQPAGSRLERYPDYRFERPQLHLHCCGTGRAQRFLAACLVSRDRMDRA